MNPNRTPKNRYNGGYNTESRKAQQTAGKADRKPEDTLTKIEAEMDKSAADIALTISDIFKFMAMSAAIIPNMELDTGMMRLKVDDDGIFFGISSPPQKCHKTCCAELDDDFEDDWDEEEEGTLYDGD